MITKVVLLHQENYPAHKSMVALTAVHDFYFELVAVITNLILVIWQPLQP